MANFLSETLLQGSTVVVFPVQDDQYNYHDSLQVRLRAIISSERKDVRIFSIFQPIILVQFTNEASNSSSPYSPLVLSLALSSQLTGSLEQTEPGRPCRGRQINSQLQLTCIH